MINVNPKKRPNAQELMDNPIFKKRQQKYFPEFEEEGFESNFAGQSSLLKTIRMPNNYMHLSSRLPKKNYDHSLDGGVLSSDRKTGGNAFKHQYHNTMGKRKSTEKTPKEHANDQSPKGINSLEVISPNSGVLKLPQIKNINSPVKRDAINSSVNKKSPYEAMRPA
jgi:hypothetical protein